MFFYIIYINVYELHDAIMWQRATNNVKELRITSQRATHYVKLLTTYVMNIPNQLEKQ